MKPFLHLAIVASAFAASAHSYSQATDSSLTRAQVEAQLVQYVRAGYSPAKDHIDYPSAAQEIQARMLVDDEMDGSDTGYGGTSSWSRDFKNTVFKHE
ncbi:DUF4148 domain-containing protein [Paraburkholderia sp. C35]|uniref:DUF4148 domain-containing protein n=1 Tax=Paraburkholderia sp. C35 TaxID=2126993 RepID=UPI0013A54910|nr:DUF4148 domain-containing protein [Paraburkholderia sp. C35]